MKYKKDVTTGNPKDFFWSSKIIDLVFCMKYLFKKVVI